MTQNTMCVQHRWGFARRYQSQHEMAENKGNSILPYSVAGLRLFSVTRQHCREFLAALDLQAIIGIAALANQLIAIDDRG